LLCWTTKKASFAIAKYAARSKESHSLCVKEKVNENHVLSKNIINPRKRVESNTTKIFGGVSGLFFFLFKQRKQNARFSLLKYNCQNKRDFSVEREGRKENKQEILIPFCGILHHKLFPNSLQFWLTRIAAYLSWRETCKAVLP